MRINDRITGINGVAVSGMATVELPLGRRYHGLTFYYKTNASQADIEAAISFIRLYVGGVIQRDINVAELFKRHATAGRAFVLGEIPIFFSEPERADVMGEEATSWDVTGQTSFTVEIGFTGAAVAPAVSGFASFDFERNDGEGANPGANIVRWQRQSVNLAVGNANNVKTLPKGVVQRLTVFTPTSAVSAARVQVNNRTKFDLSRTEATNLLAKYGYTTQALTMPIYYDFTAQITDALPVAALDDYDVQLTSADAQNAVVLSEVRYPGFN